MEMEQTNNSCIHFFGTQRVKDISRMRKQIAKGAVYLDKP